MYRTVRIKQETWDRLKAIKEKTGISYRWLVERGLDNVERFVLEEKLKTEHTCKICGKSTPNLGYCKSCYNEYHEDTHE